MKAFCEVLDLGRYLLGYGIFMAFAALVYIVSLPLLALYVFLRLVFGFDALETALPVQRYPNLLTIYKRLFSKKTDS